MTSLNHLYGDLSTFAPPDISTEFDRHDDSELEEAKLSAFENGYCSGWEDAVKAKTAEGEQLNAAFVRHLEDMTFTYHEAFAKISAAMRPLLTRFITELLPELARKNIGPLLMERISELIESQAKDSIAITVAPEVLPSVKTALEDRRSVPFTAIADPALGPAQAYLKVNDTEEHLNLDGMIQTLNDIVEGFLHTADKEARHD